MRSKRFFRTLGEVANSPSIVFLVALTAPLAAGAALAGVYVGALRPASVPPELGAHPR